MNKGVAVPENSRTKTFKCSRAMNIIIILITPGSANLIIADLIAIGD
jgi:hypothetical protein